MSAQERCAACGSSRFVRIRLGGPDGFLRAQCVPCGRIREPLATWQQKHSIPSPSSPTEPSDTVAELIGDVEYDSIRDEWRASPTEPRD